MDLADVRRVFARQMLSVADATENKRLEDAFTSVPRENFLGPPPWHILSPWAQGTYAGQDPALIYQDVVIAIDEQRGVNNGSPSLHARCLHLLSPREGETVVHIGAGNGYYSAILSELVGSKGHVIAVEYDAKSADRARENLSDRPNVDVVHGNGFDWPQDKTDIVYVNFATPRPAAPWIENLKNEGRLAFPLGVPRATRVGGLNFNAVAFIVTRIDSGYMASAIAPVSFIFAEGLTPEPKENEFKALQKSLKKGGWGDVRSLVWHEPANEKKCWYVGPDWTLSFDEVAR
jgi:protein-L-isoaspartate(D-aspartate) O-methyltransferase